MRAQDFLEHFLPGRPDPLGPSSQFTAGMFDEYIQILSKPETEWYDVFVSSDPRRPPHCSLDLILPFQIKIISPHFPKLNIINTSNVTDEAPNKLPFALKPDCSVYTNDKYTEKKLIFSLVDFIIEFKKGSDPFIDPKSKPNSPENLNPEPESASSNPFVCSTGSGLEHLGQITAYAATILSAQYRTHLFMVFIVKGHARLLRWDRGGAVVTEQISLANEPQLFFDFLIRYNSADSKVRGHDSTVKLPNDEEVRLAKEAVPELADVKSFLAVDISDRRYIIQGPEIRPRIPVGRWTRPSFAYGIEEKRRVFLKDSWRVLLPGIKPEGEIYERLRARNVPNIPLCLLASDVDDDTHHRSRTHEVTNKCKVSHPGWKITPHRHYRIVLGTIGRRLETFKCTKELVGAMHAALRGEMTIFLAVSLRSLTHIIAHKAAYDADILHRDISAGNILIVGEEELNSEDAADDQLNSEDARKSKIDGGMLIDWDLSKPVNRDDTTARQYTRTVS
jgi:hypothetical protein